MDAYQKKTIQSLSLEEYAQHYHLPVDFLASLGCKDMNKAVGIPYYDENKQNVIIYKTIWKIGCPDWKEPYFEHREINKPPQVIDPNEKSCWILESSDKSKPDSWMNCPPMEILYGFWMLNQFDTYVIFANGEAEAQILWYLGFNAVFSPSPVTWEMLYRFHMDKFERIFFFNLESQKRKRAFMDLANSAVFKDKTRYLYFAFEGFWRDTEGNKEYVMDLFAESKSESAITVEEMKKDKLFMRDIL